MIKYLFIFFILFQLLNTKVLLAQKESNIWYFGDHIGLDFNTNPPTQLLDNAGHSYNSSASVCDSSGNLLFYVTGPDDGVGPLVVYNKQHQIMLNGDSIQVAPSLQSPLAIPISNNNNLYYVFTTLQGDSLASPENKGLSYSVIDMSLDNGLGAVVDSLKDIHIYQHPIHRGATIMKHAHPCGVWIVFMKNELYNDSTTNVLSLLVTPEGVTESVTSTLPYKVLPNFIIPTNNEQYISFRINLGATNWSIILCEFDNVTGKINPSPTVKFNLGFLTGGNSIRTWSFSPDNSKLYLPGYGGSAQNSGLFQYDLSSFDSTAITNSQTQLTTTHITCSSLGPDGKIYFSKYTSGLSPSWIGVIHAPNNLGTLCNIEEQYFEFDTNWVGQNFPSKNIERRYFDPYTSFEISGDTNVGDVISFILDNEISPLNITWYFGDGDSSNLLSPQHTFIDTGIYQVIVIADYGCDIDTIIQYVSITDFDASINVPSIFSPNADGMNDAFSVFYSGIKELSDFKIYNRWGVVIFQTKDLTISWDGYYQNRLQENGVYIYEISAVTFDNKNISSQGTICLIN